VRTFSLLAVALLSSCKSCDEPGKGGPPADAAVDAAPARPDGGSDAAAPAADDGGRVDAAIAIEEPEPEPDAGPSPCRLVYGPAEQPFRGPAALSVSGQDLRMIGNESGKPRIYPLPIPPAPRGAPAVVPPRPTSFVGMRWPPCDVAGRFVYCQGAGGVITRSVLGAEGEPRSVAKSRAGTRIAAAALGPDHSVVAFLDVRRTSEGDMLQAFVALDEKEPVRLSDDGAGATTLRFLPRGDAPVAVYLDTRTAMVPVHARPVSLRGADLALGADAVIFVGGAPERGVDVAVSAVGAKSFAFVPLPRETTDFGMAALVIEDPPKDDVAAVWSRYPNGLDPAPIAAAPSRDGKTAWIARVRPAHKLPSAPRILELGRVDASGVFTSYGEIAPGKAITDVALVDDGAGVWIEYGDTTITWLERRICGG
jgi:hypothetical protein